MCICASITGHTTAANLMKYSMFKSCYLLFVVFDVYSSAHMPCNDLGFFVVHTCMHTHTLTHSDERDCKCIHQKKKNKTATKQFHLKYTVNYPSVVDGFFSSSSFYFIKFECYLSDYQRIVK